MGLGLVLAYRLSVEVYDRLEYSRFEKERQQLNWKQVRPALKLLMPSPPLSTTRPSRFGLMGRA